MTCYNDDSPLYVGEEIVWQVEMFEVDQLREAVRCDVKDFPPAQSQESDVKELRSLSPENWVYYYQILTICHTHSLLSAQQLADGVLAEHEAVPAVLLGAGAEGGEGEREEEETSQSGQHLNSLLFWNTTLSLSIVLKWKIVILKFLIFHLLWFIS